MKKRLVIMALTVMLILVSTLVFAQDIKTTLSLKGWYNSMEIKLPLGEKQESDNTVLMIGPGLNVTFGNNIFLGGSLLRALSDYEFSYYEYPSNGVEKISRTDIDLMGGYMFTPRFGAFIGYKYIGGDYTDEWPKGRVWSEAKYSISGPGIGILGNIPLSKTVLLYGNLSYMSLDFELDPDTGLTVTEAVDGASAEIGVAFAVSPKISLNVGFKSQSLEAEIVKFTFTGLTVGFNYNF